MKGYIRMMPEGKSFAFINADNGSSVFVHRDDYRDNWQTLLADFHGIPKTTVKVKFDLVETDKGPRAENCRRITHEDDNNG